METSSSSRRTRPTVQPRLLQPEVLENRELLNGDWSPFQTICTQYEINPVTGQQICVREEDAPPPSWQNPDGNYGNGYDNGYGNDYDGYGNGYDSGYDNGYDGSGTGYDSGYGNGYDSQPDFCYPGPHNNWCYVGMPHEPSYGQEPQVEKHKGKNGKHGHKYKAKFEGNQNEPPGWSKKKAKKAKFENSALAWMMDRTHYAIDDVLQNDYRVSQSPLHDLYQQQIDHYIQQLDQIYYNSSPSPWGW